ncbi:MAG: ABC transporter permease [Zoogloeaceae bacterium]|jgi:phospholipid/cholesterol/gamma-HCH transport system permease protein|nr:ABC transporter permease [Zoogloeaceae bacterium]
MNIVTPHTTDIPSVPALRHTQEGVLMLSGEWTLASLLQEPAMRAALLAAVRRAKRWDLSAVTRMDSALAVLLWRLWGERFPEDAEISPMARAALERIAALPVAESVSNVRGESALVGGLQRVGVFTLGIARNTLGLVDLLGRLVLSAGFLCRNPKSIPWKELSANIFRAGVEALPVSALVGFLIGVTISYLSALQLKTFGADIFIVNILGVGIIRELGPVLVAVLVAGRSGSAMTAQIGVMRVTEEIDALAVMGVSVTLRVVLPKVAALVLVMPLLVVWSCMAALLGGSLAAWKELDLSVLYFFSALPEAVPIANLWIGLCKGILFGGLISIIACHFGLHVRPNTESLSRRTTASVVSAITLVIIADAILAVFTRDFGV